jgi:phage baseplate assembly protein gpV
VSRLDLDRMGPTTERAARLRGVYLAIVTSNSKSGGDSRYRVKVKFPWLPDGDESYWARILVPMAGAGRGSYFLPEVGDQLLVVFEHGDVARPIIVGGLWSEEQPPPQRNDDGKNNVKVIKSKSGHRLIFDDTEGGERVTVVDSTRRNKIVLDSAGNSLTIQSAGDIELLARSGAVKVHGQTVKISTRGGIDGSGASIDVSGGAMNVAASGMLELKGGTVMLNPPGGGAAGAQPGAVRSAGMMESAGVAAAMQADELASASAAAREAASGQHLPDNEAEPPMAAVGAGASASEITPGEPVEVSATVDGSADASYQVVDADTGEVIDEGPAEVSDGRATARFDSKKLDDKPETSSVKVVMVSGGQRTETRPLPVAGRGGDVAGAPSPSNRLIDPAEPMPAAGDGAARRTATADHRTPTVAPTVDHRGRAMDHRGMQDAGSGGARAGGRSDVKVGSAAVSAIEGDSAGAVRHVAGGRAGAAASGDAAGVAGGGAGGHLATGDARGAAVASGQVDSRAARIDSSEDVEREVADRSTQEGKQQSGVAAAERDAAQAENRAAREMRDVEHQADVEGRARGEVSHEQNKVAGEVQKPRREADDLRRQGDVEARAEAEVSHEKSAAQGEVRRVERDVRRPESEVRGRQSQGELKVADHRDPERVAERESRREVRSTRDHREMQNARDAENAARDAERTSDDPGQAGKQRVKKLDEE